MADDQLTLYWCPMTRAARGYWMVEELGTDYELVEIDIRDENAPPDPQFLAASPMGKVPAITHVRNGQTTHLAESAAICLYLQTPIPTPAWRPDCTLPNGLLTSTG